MPAGESAASIAGAAAADSLALHGGPAAIVALLEVMESGPTAEARLAAGEALAQKYGVVTTLDPSDSNLWDNAVESMKLVKSVQEAFQNVNRPSAVRTERLHISEHRCDDPTWSPPGASGSGEAPQSKERATWPSEPSP